jgi:hypothetical protein
LIVRIRVLVAAAAVCMAGAAFAAPPPAGSTAQPAPAPTPTPAPAPPSPGSHVRDTAQDIVTQPARDVGVSKVKIPTVLAKASDAPYSLEGLKTCRQILGAVQELNLALGPDFHAGDKYQENRMAKLAEAGGTTVVNSFIPFRGLVREATGAAPADRRLRAATSAGYARRGFLRGVYLNRKCKPTL